VLTRVGLALLVSVAMGVLMAGLAFPVVGGAGLAAKSGADDFLALPADLAAGPPPQRSRILAADGSLLATLYLQNRVNVSLKQVPLEARQAIVAIEDSRFYAHHGVDFKGIIRAAVTNAGAGGVRQGASTLTQQYVKNALIESAVDKKGQQAAKADSIDRKLREARYAMAIERRLTKDEILERYLNIAYYGHGVYGIGTAANYYFAKPVGKLSLAESALLAGMVKNPNTYDPSSKDPDVRVLTKARRDTVLARMFDLGFIQADVKARAEAAPLFTRLRPVVSGCENPAVRSPFFCDYVRRELEDGPVGAALGATREERQRTLLGGGLTIKTSLDPKMQAAAQQAVNEKVPPTDKFGAAAAIDTVEPGTGHIKAMAVDRPYAGGLFRATKVNYATGGVYGFQAGSTFKAFVLAEALKQGIPLNLRLHAPQTYTSKVFKNVKDGRTEPYKVQNAGDSEAGTFDLESATHLSVNTYFIQLEERTGIERPAALAESLGVHRVKNQVSDQPLQRVPSLVLGTNGVSPLDMASAYAAFAAHGLYCPPRAVTEILGADRKPIALPPNGCEQVLDAGVADTVTSVLRGVIDGPEAYRTGARASLGRPAAGKTGTVQNSWYAWFVGYTPQLATAVWMGRPDTLVPMKGVTINGRYYKQVYGGDIPAAIWKQAMTAEHEGLPVVDFAKADADVVDGDRIPVPDVTGQPYDAAKQALTDAGFVARGGGLVSAGPVPFGSVGYTSPRAGTLVIPGATITVYVSNGRVRAVPSPSPTPAYSPPPVQQSPAPSPRPKPTKKGGRG
jgi:membrane peptidoglycan carboxypeptidase